MKPTFKFSVPLELLEKNDHGYKIRGVCSTEDKDLQGEIVKQNGIDFSHIKKGLGLFNWNHKNDPQYILGKIENAKVENNHTVVEGYLFDKVDNAKAIVQIMQSLKPEDKHRVQMSVEGKVVDRAGANDKIIKQCKVERVALTLDAVNTNTYAELTKSLMSDEGIEEETVVDTQPNTNIVAVSAPIEETITISKTKLHSFVDKAEKLEKMLTIGTGYADAPGALSGGAAIATESVDGEEKDVKTNKKKKKKKVEGYIDTTKKSWDSVEGRQLFKSIVYKFKTLYPELSIAKCVEVAEDYINTKLDKGISVLGKK